MRALYEWLASQRDQIIELSKIRLAELRASGGIGRKPDLHPESSWRANLHDGPGRRFPSF